MYVLTLKAPTMHCLLTYFPPIGFVFSLAAPEMRGGEQLTRKRLIKSRRLMSGPIKHVQQTVASQDSLGRMESLSFQQV